MNQKLLYIVLSCVLFSCEQPTHNAKQITSDTAETISQNTPPPQNNVENAIKQIDDMYASVSSNNVSLGEACQKYKKNTTEVQNKIKNALKTEEGREGLYLLVVMCDYKNTGLTDDIIAYKQGRGALVDYKSVNLSDKEWLEVLFHYVELSYAEWKQSIGEWKQKEIEFSEEQKLRLYSSTKEALEYLQSNNKKYFSEEKMDMIALYLSSVNDKIDAIEQKKLKEKMNKIHKQYNLKYHPIGYCERSIAEYLYNSFSFNEIDCILKSPSMNGFRTRVLQVLPTGVLVKVIDYNGIPYGKIAFIKTSKKYVDDDYINSGEFYYDGVFTYTILLGGSKTIDKLVEINN